jgi:tyrosyl-tRNA synthetase
MFGKVMSVCDGLMWRMYTLLSSKTSSEIDALKQGHPKAAKVELAREIVARYHGPAAALAEVQNFEKLHSKEGKADIPDDAPRFTLEQGKPVAVVDALAETQLSESKTKARALIAQGGLFVNGERINDVKFELPLGTHAVRVGKKAWARITVC